jgi:hypothetical protein
MNERTPPPKLENISAAIKFTTTGPDQFGKSRLVASLHVASSCWFTDGFAKSDPQAMVHLKEKLKRHLLRQLYHDQRREIDHAVTEFFRNWPPIQGIYEAMNARDLLVKLTAYSPPAGFDDDDDDCDRGANCGCEQFEFLLQPSPKRISRD